MPDIISESLRHAGHTGLDVRGRWSNIRAWPSRRGAYITGAHRLVPEIAAGFLVHDQQLSGEEHGQATSLSGLKCLVVCRMATAGALPSARLAGRSDTAGRQRLTLHGEMLVQTQSGTVNAACAIFTIRPLSGQIAEHASQRDARITFAST